MLDSALEIRGEGRGRGGGNPDPYICNGAGGLPQIFRPFGPQFGPKIRGQGGPPGPLP